MALPRIAGYTLLTCLYSIRLCWTDQYRFWRQDIVRTVTASSLADRRPGLPLRVASDHCYRRHLQSPSEVGLARASAALGAGTAWGSRQSTGRRSDSQSGISGVVPRSKPTASDPVQTASTLLFHKTLVSCVADFTHRSSSLYLCVVSFELCFCSYFILGRIECAVCSTRLIATDDPVARCVSQSVCLSRGCTVQKNGRTDRVSVRGRYCCGVDRRHIVMIVSLLDGAPISLWRGEGRKFDAAFAKLLQPLICIHTT